MLHTTREWWVLSLKYKFKGLQNKSTILKETTILQRRDSTNDWRGD